MIRTEPQTQADPDGLFAHQRLQLARKMMGIPSATQAARFVNVPVATYTAHENGTRVFPEEVARKYGDQFNVPWQWLKYGMPPSPLPSEVEEQVRRENQMERPPITGRAIDRFNGPPDTFKYSDAFAPRFDPQAFTVPIYGQQTRGRREEGEFVLKKRAGYTFCPPLLVGVEEAYAVYCFGTSMLPRYEPGEMLWVHPDMPVRQGDYVVAQLRLYEDGPPVGFAKRLVIWTSEELVLEQLEPPMGCDRHLTFKADQVQAVHKIILSGERQ